MLWPFMIMYLYRNLPFVIFINVIYTLFTILCWKPYIVLLDVLKFAVFVIQPHYINHLCVYICTYVHICESTGKACAERKRIEIPYHITIRLSIFVCPPSTISPLLCYSDGSFTHCSSTAFENSFHVSG